MSERENELLRAFREDHARLGRGFHELSESLRTGDAVRARAVAASLDRQAGAHIAFEERDFYPLLAAELGREAVDRMMDDHMRGLGVVHEALALPEGGYIPGETRDRLLHDSETMETHIAECGELFSAMSRISLELQDALYRRLSSWRERRPRWTEFAERYR